MQDHQTLQVRVVECHKHILITVTYFSHFILHQWKILSRPNIFVIICNFFNQFNISDRMKNVEVNTILYYKNKNSYMFSVDILLSHDQQ